MSVTKIAARYAKSLIELAAEAGKLNQVHDDMLMLRQAAQNRDLRLMLKSPVIQNDKKNAALQAIFTGKIDALTLSYLQLLVNKNRESFIPEITDEFIDQYKTMNKITSLKVITASELSDATLDALRKKIVEAGVTFENLDIETQIDPKIVGGFILEFDNKRYDASVIHKLTELKNQFQKNLYIREV
ncbi:MAG: ATP synthase F1 subunit delta [Bacteroidetes bacterium]|nr:ATP synthase F1 subunit delta [Bacteroidota bacterium]